MFPNVIQSLFVRKGYLVFKVRLPNMLVPYMLYITV